MSHMQACAGVERATVKPALGSGGVSGHRGLSLLSGAPSNRDACLAVGPRSWGGWAGNAGPGSLHAWTGRVRPLRNTWPPQIRGERVSGRGSPPLSSACPSRGPLPSVSNVFADQVLKGPSILTSLEHRGEERGLGPREAHVFLEITQPVQTESGTGGSQARPRVLGAGGQGGLPGGNRDGTEGTYGVGGVAQREAGLSSSSPPPWIKDNPYVFRIGLPPQGPPHQQPSGEIPGKS